MRESFEEQRERYAKRPRRDVDEFSGAGGFQSAEHSRDALSWMKSQLSPDSALEEDRQEMIERVDSAVKNYELAANHVEGRVIRVAGWGMTVEPEIGFDDANEEGEISAEQDEWNKILRTNWEIVAERIGKNGEELWQIQHQMQRDYEKRGEWFLLIGDEADPLSPITLKVEAIDPDLISTPDTMAGDRSVRMGIKVDANGRPIGCYIRESHPGDTLDVKWRWRYEPFVLKNGMPRIIHHHDRKRSTRGFPRMQVGIRRLKNAEEYDQAELERNFVAACHVGVIRTELAFANITEKHGALEDSQGRRVREMSPGQFVYAGPTDQVAFNSPNGPSEGFGPYIEHEGRMFAAGCGTHLELLSGDWKQMSYSTARLLWNVEDGSTAVLQVAHECTVRWIYRHFVTRMILAGLVDIDSVEYRANPWPFWASRIILPPHQSIDPQREDRNEQVNIEACMQPGSDMAERINGKPARVVYAAVKRDRALRKKFGLEEHLPQMNRDQELMPEEPGGTGRAPTQAGDSNQESSDANIGAAA